jgi:hypothetical protein
MCEVLSSAKEHFPRRSLLAHTVWAVKSILVVVLGGVELGGQHPRNVMWCEVLLSASLLHRQHDTFYSG